MDMDRQPSKAPGKIIILAGIAAYVLIGIEIIIMISPFALYFYSVYAPILDSLAASPLTAWTTEFFLPHMVFPDDPLINFISYLQIFLIIGLVLFFGAAIPLYYGRFTGKGVVQNSFYAKVRHPQYLFLAISGFGLLLYWPRFIILIMYINMLFVYYLLARNEEWRMRREQPIRYDTYLTDTPMFLPGEPGGKIFRKLFGRLQPKWLGILAAYFVSMTLAIILAMGLRSYTVSQLPHFTTGENKLTLVSVFPRDNKEITKTYEAALLSETASRHTKKDRDVNLIYIMPGDFFLTALVTDENRKFSEDMIERFPEILEWHKHKFKGGLGKFFRIFYNYVKTINTVETDYDVERLVFVKVTNSAGQLIGTEDIFDLGMKREPVLIVDIDADTHEISTVIEADGTHKWGRMPMPTF